MMKKLIAIAAAAMMAAAALAQVNISKVDKAQPNDEIFMDMAVTAAQRAKAAGQPASGAVVILNGAWKATGTPHDGLSPEEDAIAKTRRTSLSGATIYTVNQPTTAAMNAIMRAGADAVFFVNPSATVVEAGIYPADAYDSAGLDSTLTAVPLKQIPYEPARQLCK